MRPNAKINRSQIALLHVAKSKVGLSEQEYRDLLGRYGVATSKDLNSEQLEELIRHLKDCGFQMQSSVPGAPEIEKQPAAKRPNLRKIWALLKKQGLPWSYADGVAWRMHQVTKTIWCTPEQLHKIVIALEYRAKQEGPQAGTPAPPGDSHE